MSDKKNFKAMVLDERDVMIGVVELEDEAQLTPRHVDLRPHGGDCDQPVGMYRWSRERKALEPLPRQQRAKAGRPTLEMAIAFDYLHRWDRSRDDPAVLTEVTFAWLDDVVRTVDFGPFLKLPVIADYMAARGLTTKD